MNAEYLSVKELSEYFSIPKRTIYQMITDKIIPHIKIGNVIRIRKKDVETIEKENYIRAKRVSPF